MPTLAVHTYKTPCLQVISAAILLSIAAVLSPTQIEVVTDAASSVDSCPAGFTSSPEVGSFALAGGGVDDRYVVNGMTSDALVPPQDFDPLTAPDDQLATYGFPPRSSANVASWTARMQAWRWTPDEGICVGPSGMTFGSKTSASWSGYEVLASSTTWDSVNATFGQATYADGGCSSQEMGSWVGLGGWYSSNFALIQAGTAMTSSSYFAWYEYLNTAHSNPPITFTSVHVHPGDSVYSYVYYTASTGNANLFVQDNTNGTYGSHTLSSASSYYDGRSAEFVTERADGGPHGGYYGLPNYDHVSFSGASEEQTNGTWHDLGDQSPWSITMKNSGGTILADPSGLISSESFLNWWEACD